jgi:oxygen-independent coproporphyrinogen-3 oxidase
VSGGFATLELERIGAALGPTPPVTRAAAHVYPAAAPAFTRAPEAQREPFAGDQLRLYVHVPFCNYKCNFCFYATRVGDGWREQERYVAALARELEIVPPGAPLTQLFVGGGTPTALPAELFDRTLAAVLSRVSPVGDEVHTVEASPESLGDAHLDAMKRHGIGRVSMGVQSLDEDVLEAVHRRHGLDQVLDACDRAVASGLIVNIDLMYGLPGQTEASFERDLATVAARGVHSVTLYDLRITGRTALGKALRQEERLDLARLLRWRGFVGRAAEAHGFRQTRWHTWKRLDGPARRHRRAPCNDADGRGYQIGIGMSARSHLGYTVYRNHERMAEYVARIEAGRSPVEWIFPLDEEARRTQFLARSIGDGGTLALEAFRAAFGRELGEAYGDVLQRHLDGGLLVERDGAISLSETGRLVYDRVLLGYYPRRALDWLWARA